MDVYSLSLQALTGAGVIIWLAALFRLPALARLPALLRLPASARSQRPWAGSSRPKLPVAYAGVALIIGVCAYILAGGVAGSLH